MILFTLLVGLAIDRASETVARWRSFGWFTAYSARLRRGLGAASWTDGPLGLALVLLFPVLVVVLLQQVFAAMWGLFGFLFALAVLVYTLGPRDLERDVRRFLAAWEQGNEGEAWALVREIDADIDSEEPSSPLGRVAVEGIAIAAHERILGVLFWFVALGPAGALLFRLLCLSRETSRREEPHSGYTRAIEIAYGVIGWPSSRLAALGYALVGSFADALYGWRDAAAPRGVLDYRRILAASGLGALQVDEEALEERGVSVLHVRAALAMVWRTVILALVLIALATFGSALF